METRTAEIQVHKEEALGVIGKDGKRVWRRD
jgi:predicted RNA-binding protein YlqC (UPF0109 family)